jgi:hypothetical protein
MTNNTGTLIIAPVRPQSTADTYPTAYASDLLGGHQEFATLAERDAIPAERREEGMTVWVVATETLYVLSGGIANTNWLPFSTGGGGSSGFSIEFTGVGAGQSVSLPATPGAAAMLIIQGLVESPANYSVSGTTLVIPAALVWDGAICQFVSN